MTVVGRWTGREAKLLRVALRLSIRDFSARLGVAARTVNTWEERQADITPLPHMQEVLDTALSQASDQVKARFTATTRAIAPEPETADLTAPIRGALLPLMVNGRLVWMPFDAAELACTSTGCTKKICGAAEAAPLGVYAGGESLKRLPSANRRPSRVSHVSIETLERGTQVHRDLYHDLSSAELLPAVTGHLEVVTLLLGGTQPLPLRRRLAAIAAEAAGHAAWLCHDLGDWRSAEHYYGVADTAVGEADNPALNAYIRGFRSLVVGSQGRTREALGLIQSAVQLARSSATATTKAWLAGLEAQALACVGNRRACSDALRRADTTLGQARREEDPAWMYEFDHTRLLALSGACYGQLGRVSAAEQALHEAMAALGPRRTRRRAEILLNLAKVRIRQLNPEEAVGLAIHALEIAVETGSLAGIRQVSCFRSELDQWNGTRAVAALDERLVDAG